MADVALRSVCYCNEHVFALCFAGAAGACLMLCAQQGTALRALADVLCIVGGAGSPFLMLLWGARFASTPRRQAFVEVCRSSLIALALTLACSCCVGAGVELLQVPLLLASSVLFVVCQVRSPMCAVARDAKREALPALARFATVRFCIGATLGIMQVAVYTGEAALAEPLAVALFVALCAALFVRTRTAAAGQSLLPVLPSAAGMGMVLLSGPLSSYCPGLLWACVWFGWIAMSSVELSELKYEFGLGEFLLAFGEKAVVVAGIAVGNVGCRALATAGCDVAGWSPVLLLVATVAVCGYASYRLAGLAQKRDRESIIEQVSASRGGVLGRVFDLIAADYGLSAREGEILSYVAEGHTRAFISNSMDIAPGTVKSHVSHVYAKLDCYSREDVMALVRQYESRERGER